ncbi:hypothetical protein EON63_01210 [archaeon]|nr:MAG: hypothetical protein EON63_01210 [archaeon]
MQNQLISTFSTLGIDRYPFSLAIHPRSRIITAGCTDGSILTFHTHVKTPLHSSLAHGQCITSCAYTSMGDELLTSSSEGLLRQWVPARNMLCMRSVVPSASDVPV